MYRLRRGYLDAQVLDLMPTPCAALASNGGSQDPEKRRAGGHSVQLHDVIEHLTPTPTASRWGRYADAVARQEKAFGIPAPDATEPGARGNRRLSARFCEWMMGLPAGWICDVPGISRRESIELAGNGVVPQQAELALRVMLERMS